MCSPGTGIVAALQEADRHRPGDDVTVAVVDDATLRDAHFYRQTMMMFVCLFEGNSV